jgi:hypothetical protein
MSTFMPARRTLYLVHVTIGLRELRENDLGMVTSCMPSPANDFESEDQTTVVRKHQGLGSPLYHFLFLLNAHRCLSPKSTTPRLLSIIGLIR